MSDFQVTSSAAPKAPRLIPKGQLPSGIKVRAYWNSNKKCFSVMSKGKVISHADLLVLSNCKFIVKESGQKRARKEGVKNVHAFVEGVTDFPYLPTEEAFNRIVEVSKLPSTGSPSKKEVYPVCYNPWQDSGFWTYSEKTSAREDISNAEFTYLRVHTTPTQKGLVKKGSVFILK